MCTLMLQALLQRHWYEVPTFDKSIHTPLQTLLLTSTQRAPGTCNALACALLGKSLNFAESKKYHKQKFWIFVKPENMVGRMLTVYSANNFAPSNKSCWSLHFVFFLKAKGTYFSRLTVVEKRESKPLSIVEHFRWRPVAWFPKLLDSFVRAWAFSDSPHQEVDPSENWNCFFLALFLNGHNVKPLFKQISY